MMNSSLLDRLAASLIGTLERQAMGTSSPGDHAQVIAARVAFFGAV
jgi:hypothetical protein